MAARALRLFTRSFSILTETGFLRGRGFVLGRGGGNSPSAGGWKFSNIFSERLCEPQNSCSSRSLLNSGTSSQLFMVFSLFPAKSLTSCLNGIFFSLFHRRHGL